MMASRRNPEPSGRRTSINDLPQEILVHILSLVPLPERLNCALACRSFARALSAPKLTRDLQFNVVGIDEPKTLDALYYSHRQYRNLRLSKVRMFAFDTALWERIGKSTRELELIDCMWSPVAFYSILQACPNLESLMICSDVRKSEWHFSLPANLSLERIKESTRNVRHLHVGFLAKANMLSSLLAALPDALSISLTKFDRNSDFVERLPELLGTSRKITRFDINILPGGGFIDAEQILRTCMATVEDIRSDDATFFTPALMEMIGNCAELRCLKLKRHHPAIIDYLITLPQNDSKLEAVELGSIMSVAMCVDVFTEFEKLRQLSLGLRLTSNSLAISQFSRLVETTPILGKLLLDLCESSISNEYLRSLEGLPNLQALVLANLEWEAHSFRILFASLKNLRNLTINGSPVLHQLRANRTSDGILCRCRNSFEQQIIDFFERPRSERHLDASKLSSVESLVVGSSEISDVGLVFISHCQPQLREFTLIRCQTVTDAGLEVFLHGEPQLEKLELRSLETPNGTFLRALGELCPRLRVLKLSRCREISCSIVRTFKLRRPTVKVYFDEDFIVL